MKQPTPAFPQLSGNRYLIDTHCHLDMEQYSDDLDGVIDRAIEHNVTTIVTIGTDVSSSKQAVKIAQKHKDVFAAIGVHPHDVDNLENHHYDDLRTLYKKHKKHIVGYGEIGLDYVKMHSDPLKQRYHFNKQLELAKELHLPIIVHNREAETDTLNILESQPQLSCGGIMHCFSGDYEFAGRIIDLGMLISVPGIVTFKNASTLHEVVRKIPLEYIIVETDGPFLSPHPYRGKRNEPANVLFTAAKIAQLKDIDIEEVAYQTSLNATKLFNLQ